jgi:hypothetical protein
MPDTTPLDLYRAIHKSTPGMEQGPIVDEKPVTGVLYPDFYPRKLDNGKTRAADVSLDKDKHGIEWVRPGGGTSLFDKPNVFGSKWWHSFKLPKGTEIPDSLTVVKTGYNEDRNATHYQIECKAMMTVTAMQGALDNLARNAIVQSLAKI